MSYKPINIINLTNTAEFGILLSMGGRFGILCKVETRKVSPSPFVLILLYSPYWSRVNLKIPSAKIRCASFLTGVGTYHIWGIE